MWFYISVIGFFILAIWGLTLLIEDVWLSFLKPKTAPPPTVIITLKPKICYAQLEYIKEKIRWQKCEAIILLDLKYLDDGEKEDCRKIIQDIRFMAEYQENGKEVK